MPRARNEKLCQYMHVNDPRLQDNNDKILKVRNFVTRLIDRFQMSFKPGKELSIDEAMIRFDGRLAWKQYMPKKPVNWGIKLWCFCDARTGYCLNLLVYCGADADVLARDLGLGYTVVMSLITNYLLSHHDVYADNFFLSMALVEDFAPG